MLPVRWFNKITRREEMRKSLVPAFSVVVLLTSIISAAAERAPSDAKVFGKANKARVSAYVMLIRLRSDLFSRFKETGVWPKDPEANQALTEHGKYWDEQLKAGRAILAGGMNGDYWDNVALIIFEASSQAEADMVVKNDPAVKAYVFQAQVRPFDVNFVSDKFCNTK
jgi:uncharacterized protein YciI